MSLETTQHKISHVGNGVATTFPFIVSFYDDNDIEVYLDLVKVISFYYTLNKNPENISELESITFKTAPADGVHVDFIRKTPLKQSAEFIDGGKLRAATLERSFDHIVMMIQELGDAIKKTARLNVFGNDDTSMVINESVAERQGKIFSFNPQGNLALVDNSGLKGDKGDQGVQGPSGGAPGIDAVITYDMDKTYQTDDVCSWDGKLYISIVSNNSGNDISDTSKWFYLSSIGIDQQWFDFTGMSTRRDNEEYLNDTNRPIFVSIFGHNGYENATTLNCHFKIDDRIAGGLIFGHNGIESGVSAIVGAGQIYKLDPLILDGTIRSWLELR